MGNTSFDNTDVSQKNIYNTRFCNYTLSNYFSENTSSDHVKFATQQPAMMFSGVSRGDGLNGSVIDVDSTLLIHTTQERPLEKLSLMERPFASVPYLGRGSCDPVLESLIQQGEMIHDKKSVSTIMDKSFGNYSLYLLDDNMKNHVSNYSVEEKALNGWNLPTRLNEDEYTKQANRPNINV
jgi:hypothetical protein